MREVAHAELLYLIALAIGEGLKLDEMLRTALLPPDLCRSLLPLFRKLSLAARACLHEEQLQEQSRAARAANRAKIHFLANVSHEIRTPMNAVIGMSERLLTSGLDQRQQRYAEVIRISAEALLGLIDNILDLAKIEAGRMEVTAVPFAIRELPAEVSALLAPRAAAKGLRLHCRVDPAAPARLRGDPGRIRQVLLNLADNAIKFSERGEIRLEIDAAANFGYGRKKRDGESRPGESGRDG